MALCLTTRQCAVGAQGFLNAQGFMHCLFSHAVQSGHSSLVEQPTSRLGSVGGGTRNKTCSHAVKQYSKKQNKFKSVLVLKWLALKWSSLTWRAGCKWISFIALQTFTFGSVACTSANCIYSTRCSSTCINTVSKLADIWVWAILVDHTLWSYLNC